MYPQPKADESNSVDKLEGSTDIYSLIVMVFPFGLDMVTSSVGFIALITSRSGVRIRTTDNLFISVADILTGLPENPSADIPHATTL